jgi:hypothetical protein
MSINFTGRRRLMVGVMSPSLENKMRRLLIPFVIVSLLASTAVASLYSRSPKKRVPVSLRDALTKAEELLGDDAKNRYCVGVSLYGNKEGDGKGGAWNLFYAAEDGSKKHVYINMDGRSDVKLWNGPIDWTKHEGRRTGLDDVKTRLEQLFKKQGIDAAIQIEGEQLTCTYKTRDFQTYEQIDDGSYGENLIKTVGPQSDGFTIVAQIQKSIDLGWHDGYHDGPYWRLYRRTHLMTAPETYLKAEVKYGHKCNYEFRNEMFRIFGETTQNH